MRRVSYLKSDSLRWKDYKESHKDHTVTGELLVLEQFYSPELHNTRDILVWLPPGYRESDKHCPVVYMHDGQNLFDERTSNAGEWRVDETLTELNQEGMRAIVVGIPNIGERRFFEYNPYNSMLEDDHRGQGKEYLSFIIHTVKPLIDSDFRTLPGPESTGIAGSSMGGLISLYAILVHPEVFGLCGALSTAFWFGNFGLHETISTKSPGQGRIYLDVGGKEGETFGELPEPWRSKVKDPDQAYVSGVQALRDLLLENGYQEGQSFLYVEEPDEKHQEDAWARRFPGALRFLLKK
jgi:predicted alpha/beta superfamily hydrolase